MVLMIVKQRYNNTSAGLCRIAKAEGCFSVVEEVFLSNLREVKS